MALRQTAPRKSREIAFQVIHALISVAFIFHQFTTITFLEAMFLKYAFVFLCHACAHKHNIMKMCS